MSERLTDEQLAALCSITGMPLSHRMVATRIAVAEIRERRAADLTAEEREALGGLVKSMRAMFKGFAWDTALATIDRLLERKP